jgi:DNA-binding beta-propeller fold protein YncE
VCGDRIATFYYPPEGYMHRSRGLYSALFLFFLTSVSVNAQSGAPLRLIHTTFLPGYVGDFEHFAADVMGNRLFMVAEDHKTVEVLNLRTGEPIHTIEGFTQPHAVVYLDADRILVTDGNDDFGAVHLVSGTDYTVLDHIKLPAGVDGAVLNPVNNYYYVESRGNEKGSKSHLINIIDAQNFKLIGDITLPGSHSEAMVIDKAGATLYVNLAGTNEIGVVDLKTQKLVAQWPIPDAEGENALALDEINHRLFTASHKPAKLIVFNIDTGKVVATLRCVVNSDDMSYDVTHRRVYVTGDGSVSVFQQRDADNYDHVAEIPTGYRAKTSIFVPELNRLYIAIASRGKRGGGKLITPEPGSKVEVQTYQVQN